MVQIDDKLTPIYDEVVRRNAGEAEFHQAVREVLESLGRVVATEVPSMVGSAWYPTYEATSAAVPPNTADFRNADRKSSWKSTASFMTCQ